MCFVCTGLSLNCSSCKRVTRVSLLTVTVVSVICSCCELLFLVENTNSTAGVPTNPTTPGVASHAMFSSCFQRRTNVKNVAADFMRLFVRSSRICSVYALGVCTSASGLWQVLDYLNI